MPISFMGSAIAIPIYQVKRIKVSYVSAVSSAEAELRTSITGFILKLLKGKAIFFHVTDIFGSVKEALNS